MMAIENRRNGARPFGTGDVVLSCRNLRKRFGRRVAVDGVSFEVGASEAYGLLGPNGAGKTTTIRIACGILRPDAGTAWIGGQWTEGRARRQAKASLGYVPQGISLVPSLTLVENLRFWARLYGLPRSLRRTRIAEVLELVGLEHRGRDRLEHCSGGMQRRLNLAVALLHQPRLLVLDEPTVGVDAQSRASLLSTLGHLRDQGTALLYTSHYMDEVQRLCDRVGVIDHGRFVAQGRPQALLEEHSEAPDLEALFLELTGSDLRD